MVAVALTLIGLLGQAILSLRFAVRWFAGEPAGFGDMPRAFWRLSIAGGAILLCYALYIKDPVFIIGQLVALALYTRQMLARA